MKNLIKIVAVSALGLIMTSCGAANDAYGNNNGNYPTNGKVYRTNDGNVYRQGEIYRDRNGNVYQNGRIIQSGDRTYYPNANNARRLPPGQAKKIYGGKAKDYAPGQVKKRSTYYSAKKEGPKKYYNNDVRKMYDQKGKKGKKHHGKKK